MTMIRFYLIVAGAIASAVGYLWISNQYLLSALLSAFGALASYCFARLDMRVSDLVKNGEDALKVQQVLISQQLGAPEFEICSRGETKDASGKRLHSYPYSYGENLRLLFAVAALLFIAMVGLNLGQTFVAIRTC